MSVPLPPAATPHSAEPSHHIHMAPSGRDARCSSAAARRASSGVVRRIAMPMSRRMLTPEPWIHRGRVMCSRSSTGTPCTPARSRARPPTSRQPVVVRSRLGTVPYSKAHAEGPPYAAIPPRRPILLPAPRGVSGLEPGRPRPGGGPLWSADGSSRDDAGGSPRISHSSSSTWNSEAAGSHAATANSIAPLT